MKTQYVLACAIAVGTPCKAIAQESFNMTRSVVASSGGMMEGGPFVVGMTLGQSVTGMGAGPTIKVFAEAAGFWPWGRLPVLDVKYPVDSRADTQFALFPNSPNPFTAQTSIPYTIPASAGPTSVIVRLYDLSGRQVRVLDEGVRKPGRQVTRWDGRDESGRMVVGGIYFCRMQAGSFVATRRLVLIR